MSSGRKSAAPNDTRTNFAISSRNSPRSPRVPLAGCKICKRTALSAQDKANATCLRNWPTPGSKTQAWRRSSAKVEKGVADEIRKIRFELGAAQDTIVDQDTINVQLTSDLYDNKALGGHLRLSSKEAEEQHEQTIRQLEQEANKLRNQAEDFEYKLENKDSAIAALMAELTKRSGSIESIGEIERRHSGNRRADVRTPG